MAHIVAKSRNDRTPDLVAGIGLAAALCLTGVPYWRLPYNAKFFADPVLLFGLAGLAVVAAILAASGSAHPMQIFWVMLAAIAAVMIRVIIETAKDPTDHNLWPFELIIAALVSLFGVVPGLLVGALLRRLTERPR